MSGIPFRVNDKGSVLASWMNQDKVYWAMSEDGKRFGPRTAAPAGGVQSGPIALWNKKGEVLLVYKDDQAVRYALYGSDGQPIGTAGLAGTLPGTNKVTAFVTPEGDFYVVF